MHKVSAQRPAKVAQSARTHVSPPMGGRHCAGDIEHCAESSAPNDKHRQQIRSLLQKHDPALLAFCDAAKEKFEAKLIGIQVQTELGIYAAGELGPLTTTEKQP